MISLRNLSHFKSSIFIQLRSYFTPRRATIYVPGDDERKLTKSKTLNADCIVLDCEDGVSIKRKINAREKIREFFDSLNTTTDQLKNDKRKPEFAVRVNSVESNILDDDIKTIFTGKNTPSTIFLPKVHTTDHIKIFSECLKKNLNKPKNKINLIFYAESCTALINLNEICKSSVELSKNDGYFNTAGIVFGSDDFCASLGATRTQDSAEILYARQKIVLIAKAYELQAIDMVHIAYKDLEGLKLECKKGSAMGYTGKQVIHPGQIDIVQEMFLPSSEKIEWASKLVNAFNEHQKVGKGVFVYNNSMIDMPTVKQAENIMKLINSV